MSAPYTLHAKAILALDAGDRTTQDIGCRLGVSLDYARDLLDGLGKEGLAVKFGKVANGYGGEPFDLWRLT